MMSPTDMINELKAIKEAINRIEIKGEQNANYVLFSCQRCDAVIEALNGLIQAYSNDSDKAGE